MNPSMKFVRDEGNGEGCPHHSYPMAESEVLPPYPKAFYNIKYMIFYHNRL